MPSIASCPISSFPPPGLLSSSYIDFAARSICMYYNNKCILASHTRFTCITVILLYSPLHSWAIILPSPQIPTSAPKLQPLPIHGTLWSCIMVIGTCLHHLLGWVIRFENGSLLLGCIHLLANLFSRFRIGKVGVNYVDDM